MTCHFIKGWRLHHCVEIEDIDKTFLTYARENKNFGIFQKPFLTINERSLSEKVNESSNYEFIFSNIEYLKTITQIYNNVGLTINVI